MGKMLIWVVLGMAVAGGAFWFVTSNTSVSSNPLSLVAIALVFGVSPIGTFWMLYVVIRHEKRPLPYILLAFLPYFFLAYYFERVRGNRLASKARV
jgi:hypothetical protein